MKSKHIFWGTLFISLGLLILVDNLGFISYDLYNIWKLWPLVFILWGISFLVSHTIIRGFLATVAGIILALAIFAFFHTGFRFIGHRFSIDDNGFHVRSHYGGVTQSYSEEFAQGTKTARFEFTAGAGDFRTDGTTDDLFSAQSRGEKNNFYMDSFTNRDNATVTMKMKKRHFGIFGSDGNSVEMKFNPKPVWDMNFEFGAASADFDLSPYKTESVNIKTGAASLKLKLGDLYENCDVTIKAGASSLDIYVPDSAGCTIKTEVSLSSKDFDGFHKVNDGFYTTDNIDKAKKKIHLIIQSGISTIKVHKYSGGW